MLDIYLTLNSPMIIFIITLNIISIYFNNLNNILELIILVTKAIYIIFKDIYYDKNLFRSFLANQIWKITLDLFV